MRIFYQAMHIVGVILAIVGGILLGGTFAWSVFTDHIFQAYTWYSWGGLTALGGIMGFYFFTKEKRQEILRTSAFIERLKKQLLSLQSRRDWLVEKLEKLRTENSNLSESLKDLTVAFTKSQDKFLNSKLFTSMMDQLKNMPDQIEAIISSERIKSSGSDEVNGAKNIEALEILMNGTGKLIQTISESDEKKEAKHAKLLGILMNAITGLVETISESDEKKEAKHAKLLGIFMTDMTKLLETIMDKPINANREMLDQVMSIAKQAREEQSALQKEINSLNESIRDKISDINKEVYLLLNEKNESPLRSWYFPVRKIPAAHMEYC